jgi:large subunit ribosomal protein L3
VNWDGLARKVSDPKLLGFVAFKAGMTHVQYVDSRQGAPTHNKVVTRPVTILDTPSLFVCGVRFYKKLSGNFVSVGERWANNIPKDINLERKTIAGKKNFEFALNAVDDIQLIAATQPVKSGMKKMKPDVLEIGLGGKVTDKNKSAEALLGKEISIKDIFKQGEWIDVSSVSRGYGFEGAVTRFGIRIQSRKDKQRQRKPGSIGSTVPRKVDWRVPQAGQWGFFTRTEFNKRLLFIGEDPKLVNPSGGFLRYGMIPGTFLIVEGSIPGSSKRLVVLRKAFRPHPKESPVSLSYVSVTSKQGAR